MAKKRTASKIQLAVGPGTTSVYKTGSWKSYSPKLGERVASCTNACPVHIDIPGCLLLVEEGKFEEALALIRDRSPFPSVCGRACYHFCESKCTRGDVDEPVAIRSLERFVASFEPKSKGILVSVGKPRGKKVAIVGSGPAGLTAAYFLAKMGYRVTVFEKMPVAGGLMYTGILDYRLPKKVLQFEIDLIKRLVDIRTNTCVGKDITIPDLLKQGYKAIFIAVGMHGNIKLDVPGEDLEGVLYGTSFIQDVNLGKGVQLGKRVAVIGGGNVAIDSARAALRLGAKDVYVIYRRSKDEMPAKTEEIEHAREEGVKFMFLTNPKRILCGEKGCVGKLECIKMQLGEPDESGRRRPIPVQESEFMVDVDTVIVAIGQTIDPSFAEGSPLKVQAGKPLSADPDTLATDVPGIFAGGDVVTGPESVVEAMAAGRKAAIQIGHYLKGEPLESEKELQVVDPKDIDISRILSLRDMSLKVRSKMPKLKPGERLDNFKEVELGLTKEMALYETERCLRCSTCFGCNECWIFCPDAVICERNGVFEIDLDYCKGCGICANECPVKALLMVPEGG